MRALWFITLAACGSSSPDTPVDARPDSPDARPDTGPIVDPLSFDADEGGEVRLEYVNKPDGTAGTRATAFFYDDPGSVKFHPFVSFNGCTDVTSTPGNTNWPVATNPVGERDYMDPGSVIISGGPTPLMIPRRANGMGDPLARPQVADQWFFYSSLPAGTDGPTYMTQNTSYDVIIGGSAEMPAQIFDNVLFMPAAFNLTTPGVAPYAVTSADHTFGWDVNASTPPAGNDVEGSYEIFSFVGFTGSLGPAVVCVEPNDGSITVPQAMADVVRAKYGTANGGPGSGTLARQTLTHVVRELVDENGPTGRRIDFISIWCYATPFTVP